MDSSDRLGAVFAFCVMATIASVSVSLSYGHAVTEREQRTIATDCIRHGGAWKSNQVGRMECVR